MMLGTGDVFNYFECTFCGCLQIETIPDAISKYYPDTYYSFQPYEINPPKLFSIRYIKHRLKEYALFNNNIVARLIRQHYSSKDYFILSETEIDRNKKVLDVGCGSGKLLYKLAEFGFTSLLGVDIYIQKEIHSEHLKVLKQSLHDVVGTFDLVMFHHSFEHLSNPIETLNKVVQILNDDGVCLIRIPTTSSYAWEHYRGYWVQLDAPRHFYLFSVRALELLVEQVHMVVDKIVYDSTSFQFWGSEQYLKGISLFDNRSFLLNPKNSIFSKSTIKQFEKKAKELNKNKQGDSIAVFLKKKL